jgi:hypothetical protein
MKLLEPRWYDIKNPFPEFIINKNLFNAEELDWKF